LADCVGHPHGPHHIEDIFQHSMLCGDEISSRFPLLKLAGYLHDVGKPLACTINPKTNDFTFKGHSKVGKRVVTCELKELRFSNEEINYIADLTNLHMREIGPKYPKSIRRVLRDLNETNIHYKDLVRIIIADKRANLKSGFYKVSDVRSILKAIENEINRKLPNKFQDLLINGNDVMEILKIDPGPKVGKVLNYLMEQVLDDPNLNTKSSLIKLIEEDKENG